MRPCQTYVSFGVSCQINREYLKCEKCYQKNWKYNLVPNYQKINKTIKEVKKLDDKIMKLRLRIARKTKQKKHQLRRLKDIDNVESKNILKIEKGEREIKNVKKMFEALFDTSIDSF